MSLNTAHAAGGSGVVIYTSERILIFYDGCEFNGKLDTGSHPFFKGSKKGRAYLTSHRVIFVNKCQKDGLQSISMPFTKMRQVDIKQPVFGANRIEGYLTSEPEASGAGYGWDGSLFWSLTFLNGGAIEFGQALLEAGKRASRAMSTYVMPPAPPAGWYFGPPQPQNYYAAPPPAYAPAYQDPYYCSFVGQHEAFTPIPPSQVYMMNAPPPYPGAAPVYMAQSTAAPGMQNGQVATNSNYQNGSGYYSANDPHTAYASAPPAYQENYPNKKME